MRNAPEGLPLSAEELAFLAGGRRRLAETVIAGLLAEGRARVDGDGRLDPVAGGPPPSRPLQVAAMAALGPGGRSAPDVLEAVAASGVAEDVRAHLVGRDLVPARRPGVLRAVPVRGRTAAGEAVLVAARQYWATGVAGAGLDPAMLTGAPGRVALGGWEAYPDGPVATALATAKAKHRAKQGGADGGGGGGSGGGCGGGGCGGGCGS